MFFKKFIFVLCFVIIENCLFFIFFWYYVGIKVNVDYFFCILLGLFFILKMRVLFLCSLFQMVNRVSIVLFFKVYLKSINYI